jgi:hypothetical protein
VAKLTFHLVGVSTFGLCSLFLLRDKGKRKEMTRISHQGTLKHQFLYYISIKIAHVHFQ